MIIDRATKYQKLENNQKDDSYDNSKFAKLIIKTVISKIDTSKKIALFDMDGTLTDKRFIDQIASYVGRVEEIKFFMESERLDDVIRTREIARQLTDIPQNVFEK